MKNFLVLVQKKEKNVGKLCYVEREKRVREEEGKELISSISDMDRKLDEK